MLSTNYYLNYGIIYWSYFFKVLFNISLFFIESIIFKMISVNDILNLSWLSSRFVKLSNCLQTKLNNDSYWITISFWTINFFILTSVSILLIKAIEILLMIDNIDKYAKFKSKFYLPFKFFEFNFKLI